MLSALYKPNSLTALGQLLTVPWIIFIVLGLIRPTTFISVMLLLGAILWGMGTVFFLINQFQKG